MLNTGDKVICKSAYESFMDEIRLLRKSNEQIFEDALISILMDDCEYLTLEHTQIILECSGIYGNRHFKSLVYDLCFLLGIFNEKIVYLLREELTNLSNSNDQYTKFDTWSYSDLVSQVLTDERYRYEIKEAIRECINYSKVQTFTDLKIFFALNSKNKKVDRNKRLISNLNHISIFQNSGFLCWIQEANISDIKETANMIVKFGFPALKPTLKRLIDITECIQINGCDITEKDCLEIDQIQNIVFDTIGVNAVDELSTNIFNHLNTVSVK